MKTCRARRQECAIVSGKSMNGQVALLERGPVSRGNVHGQPAHRLASVFSTGTLRSGISAVVFILLFLSAVTSAPAEDSTNRPAKWARPLSVPGVSNFFQLTTNLYRGAQPTAEGMKQLKALGIKTVVNLRNYHSDRARLTGSGLKEIHDEMAPWHATEDEVVQFLKAATDTNNLPVFVHCERGADRTGTMCAMYRIVVCGWTKQEAIDEMKNGGFDFSPVWQNLVNFIEKSDIERIKRRAGLAKP